MFYNHIGRYAGKPEYKLDFFLALFILAEQLCGLD